MTENFSAHTFFAASVRSCCTCREEPQLILAIPTLLREMNKYIFQLPIPTPIALHQPSRSLFVFRVHHFCTLAQRGVPTPKIEGLGGGRSCEREAAWESRCSNCLVWESDESKVGNQLFVCLFVLLCCVVLCCVVFCLFVCLFVCLFFVVVMSFFCQLSRLDKACFCILMIVS